MKKSPIILFILCLISLQGFGGIYLDIKIFTGYNVKSFTFTTVTGKYAIYNADKKVLEILKDESVIVSLEDTLVEVTRNGIEIGRFSLLTISGEALLNTFKIKLSNTGSKERLYDDDLKVAASGDALLIINHVELERYVAGVVQSEGGGSVKDNDFYIVQAIACRTYALNNIKKHIHEGFNLCDSVHCQLYSGRCKNNDILQAVISTAGDVIVDKDKKMISAAFHSNSGGETVNSEDIWKIPTSYLKSVTDTFSLNMPGASWDYWILTTNWLEYLQQEFNFSVNDTLKRKEVLSFRQDTRQKYLTDSIPLTKIRTDLGLKSTFFSISEQGKNTVFKGKGYGHGVGLSQQGAIRMAQLGYTYDEIIKFYYKDVEIMNYDDLIQKYNY